MEQEEREAQSAKLQELIRRGTPHDLQEANRLMKVMAGFDTRNKTDYRAKAAEEVGKIQQKAKLLEDMLQKHQAGDQIKEGDVFEVRPGQPLSWEAVVKADRMQELANALASAHPKIQKMCEEESDDHEAVAKLLEINDSIHRTLERYKLIKKGDVEGAARIPKGTLGVSGAGVKKGPDNELSLIDFGGPEDATAPSGQPSASSSAPTLKGNALEDDLLGLNLGGDDGFGQGGGISLGSTNGAGTKVPESFLDGYANTDPQPCSHSKHLRRQYKVFSDQVLHRHKLPHHSRTTVLSVDSALRQFRNQPLPSKSPCFLLHLNKRRRSRPILLLRSHRLERHHHSSSSNQSSLQHLRRMLCSTLEALRLRHRQLYRRPYQPLTTMTSGILRLHCQTSHLSRQSLTLT